MTHRDHISLGLLVYSGTLVASLNTGVPESLGLFGAHSLGAFAAFMGGVSFPDIDLLIWPHLTSGHRMRSVLHRLDVPIVLTVIFIALALAIQKGIFPEVQVSAKPISSYYYVPALIGVFTFGWFTHLLGDVIQGGVRLGFGINKRFGITSFRWGAYMDWQGIVLSTILKMGGLSAFAFIITHYGPEVFGNHLRLGLVAFLTVQGMSFSSAVKFMSSLFIFWVVLVCAAYGGLTF